MFSKYRELGLALIPLKRGQKYPTMQEWSQYSDRLPTEQESELWDRLWADGHRSVGLVLGKASGLMALDLDHPDDPELNAMAPLSPVIKRGFKGETRFFRPCPDLRTESLNGLDILWQGRQTVLPPSIHPDSGKPYMWLTPDTLESLAVAELPVLDLSFKNAYTRLFEKKYPELCRKNLSGQSVGRNNWLKDVVWAKRLNGESEEAIIEAVYTMDLHKNSPRLFTDEKEGFRAGNENEAKMNAWKFVARVTKSFIDKKAGGAPLYTPLEIHLNASSEKFASISYPEPKGTLGKLFKLNLSFGMREQPAIALGGALALASVVIANRYKFRDTWPNIYVLNVADTGTGKSFPQKIAKKMLSQDIPKENLLGAGNYRSSSALVKDLATQRERLDIIDEASSIFGAIGNGGVFQQDMDDMLCELYSNSSDLFIGPCSIGREAIRVWHPSISMMLSTTPSGLKQSISNSLMMKGFFPRCFLFIDYTYGKQQESFFNEEAYQEIAAIFRDIRENEPGMQGKGHDLINAVPNPTELKCSDEALQFLKARIFQWNEDLASDGRSEGEKVFLSRSGEQATKLALIHGALRLNRIELEDVIWACEVLDVMRKNAAHLMPQLGAENRTQAHAARVYALISERGVVTHAELIKRTRWLNKRERNDILDSLVEERAILRAQDERGGVWSTLK